MPPVEGGSSGRIIHVVEGDLIHDWCEYEYNDLTIDGKNIVDFVTENLTSIRTTHGEIPGYEDTEERKDYGRVRLTIEVLDV